MDGAPKFFHVELDCRGRYHLYNGICAEERSRPFLTVAGAVGRAQTGAHNRKALRQPCGQRKQVSTFDRSTRQQSKQLDERPSGAKEDLGHRRGEESTGDVV